MLYETYQNYFSLYFQIASYEGWNITMTGMMKQDHDYLNNCQSMKSSAALIDKDTIEPSDLIPILTSLKQDALFKLNAKKSV